MVRTCLSVVMATLFCVAVFAQDLVFWDASSQSETKPPQSVAADLSAFNLSRGPGINRQANTTTAYNSNGFTVGSSSLEQALADGDYLNFGIEPDAGFAVDFDQIQIGYRRSNTGPNRLAIIYSTDDFATYTELFRDNSVTTSSGGDDEDIDISQLDTQVGELRFRVVAWGATNSQGTFRIQDRGGFGIKLTGSVEIDNSAVGACCIIIECTDDVAQENCDGNFFGGEVCAPGLCDEVGACCVDFVCTEDVFTSDCIAQNGLFREGESCDLVTCCADGPTACCDPQFGCVQDDDLQTCTDFGGVFYPRGDCSVDNNDNGEADLCEGISPCPPADTGVEGDANGDSMVTIADVLFIIARFGNPAPSDADVNGDGMVTIADVLFTIARFGN